MSISFPFEFKLAVLLNALFLHLQKNESQTEQEIDQVLLGTATELSSLFIGFPECHSNKPEAEVELNQKRLIDSAGDAFPDGSPMFIVADGCFGLDVNWVDILNYKDDSSVRFWSEVELKSELSHVGPDDKEELMRLVEELLELKIGESFLERPILPYSIFRIK